MATVRVEAWVGRPAEEVWDAVGDVGNVHRRLFPGRVMAARLDGDVRVLTMPDGNEVRELIVSVDHELRRLAYSVIGGQRMPLAYHHAVFEVSADGAGSRLVWTTDVLPHGMAAAVAARVERGIAEMKGVLEGARRPETH